MERNYVIRVRVKEDKMKEAGLNVDELFDEIFMEIEEVSRNPEIIGPVAEYSIKQDENGSEVEFVSDNLGKGMIMTDLLDGREWFMKYVTQYRIESCCHGRPTVSDAIETIREMGEQVAYGY